MGSSLSAVYDVFADPHPDPCLYIACAGLWFNSAVSTLVRYQRVDNAFFTFSAEVEQ